MIKKTVTIVTLLAFLMTGYVRSDSCTAANQGKMAISMCTNNHQVLAPDPPSSVAAADFDFTGRTVIGLPVANVTAAGTRVLNGGGVAYTGSGLNFIVSFTTYVLNGLPYTALETPLTLSAADPSHDRIDVFYVDNTGNAGVVTGTPAATPVEPFVDPSIRCRLTSVKVPAGSSTPSVTVENIYLENTEYTMTTNDSSTINLASTNNPYAGTKCIEATNATTGDKFVATKPASGTIQLSNYANLVLHIRSKLQWPKQKGITISWTTSGVTGSATITDGAYSFDSTNTTTYQTVVIPVSIFGTGSSNVGTVTFTVAGPSSTIGFYVDNISLQSGLLSKIGGDVSSNVVSVTPGAAVVFADSTGKLITNGTAAGTVTSFSAGNLSPLFTTSVATSTTTPALTFSLSNAGANSVLSNNTGSSGAPAYTSSPGFTAINNLTTNGFVKTGGGVGTLSVDTNTYLTGNQSITLSGDTTGSGTTAITTTTGKVNGVTYPAAPSANTVPVVTSAAGGGTVTYEAVPNNALANSTITLNTGSGMGLATPGAMSLGSTYTIGTTLDNLKFNGLALGTASVPTSGGQISTILGANNITALKFKRFTDTSPTGNFLDFDNAAGSSLLTLDITGAITEYNGSAPTDGQILVGKTSTNQLLLQSVSGSGATISLSNAGVITISAIANASLSNSAITIAGTSTSLGGSITLDTITGVSSTGFLKRTGANTLTNSNIVHSFVANWYNNGSAISTGKANGYFTAPYACTITGWSISADTGTATVTTWKVASGTAVPTVSNSISTSGVSLSSGTHVRSSTTSDFTTTTVTAGDILAFNISTISGPTQLTFALECTQ